MSAGAQNSIAANPAPGVGTVRWISGPVTDILMALSWIPFSMLAMALADVDGALALLMVYVFIFSFMHQPLTLILVYGDASRFALRPMIFKWSPVIFGLAVVFSMTVTPVLLAAIAGLWNAEHTLMQRYGITRIYGRKVGQKNSGIELYMLFAWLILILLWAAADPATLDRVATLGIKGANRQSFELLAGLRATADALLPLAFGVALVFQIIWFYQERQRTSNLAKYVYLLSMAALFGVMLIDPIAGFIGYVGSHAVEYFVIVNHNLSLQYQKPGDGGGHVGTWVRAPAGRIGFFAGYALVVGAIVLVLRFYSPVFLLAFVFFTVGALHFFFDGFIWKLRQPSVAAGLGANG